MAEGFREAVTGREEQWFRSDDSHGVMLSLIRGARRGKTAAIFDGPWPS